MRDLLVTGTDTGVGKTVIAAALVTALARRGVRAIGFKPAETGVDGRASRPTPTCWRAHPESATCSGAAASATCRRRSRRPLPPSAPASRSIQTTIEARIGQLRRDGYTVVVEGAGGVMVPLSWDYTVLDLAQACDLDAVVVARAGLGTLNHVAMTVMMLRSREIPIRGIVLNGAQRNRPTWPSRPIPPPSSRMLHGVRIVEVPQIPSGAPVEGAAQIVGRLL